MGGGGAGSIVAGGARGSDVFLSVGVGRGSGAVGSR